MAKTVLVTGASAGIGKATAIYLAQNGYNVYAAARRTEKMQDLKAHGIKPISLDVTKEENLVACVEQTRQVTDNRKPLPLTGVWHNGGVTFSYESYC